MSAAFGANTADRCWIASGPTWPESSTVIMWIYPTTLTSLRRIFNQSGTSYGHDIILGATSSELDITVVGSGADAATAISTGLGLTTNKWWCIAVTESIADGGPRIFKGDLTTRMAEASYASRAARSTGIATAGDGGVSIGNLGNASGTPYALPTVPFQGRIALAARFRRRMTIGELWQQQFAPYPDADCDIFVLPGLIHDDSPTLAYDTGSESHTGTSGSASQASFTWNHLAASSGVKGIIVFTFVQANADDATSVTYGGISMTAVTGGRAVDTAGEPGDCKAWILASDTIPQGTQAVVVNRNNNANVMYAVALSFTGSYPIEIIGTPTLQQTDGTLAEQSLNSGGSFAIRCAGINSGLAAVVDNPTTPGTNNLSRGANSTAVHDLDVGARVIQVVRETTGGSGSRSCGFSASTSDDRAAVYLTVKEAIRSPNLAPLAAGKHGANQGITRAPNVPLWIPWGAEVGVSGT